MMNLIMINKVELIKELLDELKEKLEEEFIICSEDEYMQIIKSIKELLIELEDESEIGIENLGRIRIRV